MPLPFSPRISVFTALALILAAIAVSLIERASSAESPSSPSKPKTVPPVVAATVLSADPHLDKTPPRQTKGLDLIKLGWRYNCMECHKTLEAKWEMDRLWVEHKTVQLNHGNNKFCLNCHHPENRNAFKHDDGSEIPEQNVVALCARCHGTVHRDWEAGVHGRQNGYWDRSKGARSKLTCIQCHDPHNPRFAAIESLTAPHYPKRAAASPHQESETVESHSH